MQHATDFAVQLPVLGQSDRGLGAVACVKESAFGQGLNGGRYCWPKVLCCCARDLGQHRRQEDRDMR